MSWARARRRRRRRPLAGTSVGRLITSSIRSWTFLAIQGPKVGNEKMKSFRTKWLIRRSHRSLAKISNTRVTCSTKKWISTKILEHVLSMSTAAAAAAACFLKKILPPVSQVFFSKHWIVDDDTWRDSSLQRRPIILKFWLSKKQCLLVIRLYLLFPGIRNGELKMKESIKSRDNLRQVSPLLLGLLLLPLLGLAAGQKTAPEPGAKAEKTANYDKQVRNYCILPGPSNRI